MFLSCVFIGKSKYFFTIQLDIRIILSEHAFGDRPDLNILLERIHGLNSALYLTRICFTSTWRAIT